MSKKIVSVLGQEITPGTSRTLHLDVAALHTRNAVQAPIFVERAEEDGPTVLLMGGVHGDELNGIDIVRRIVFGGGHKPTRGTIICIPVLNIFGFVNLSRQFPDGRDLNRVFPGSKTGSLASQFAYLFRTQVLPTVDYVLDFHSGGASRVNSAQVRCSTKSEDALALARIFGAPFVVHSKPIAKSIRHAFMQAGKVALIFEGGMSMAFDKESIQIGVEGAERVLAHLNMIDSDLPPCAEPIEITSSRWVRAPSSGMWHPSVKLGTFAAKGSILGTVSDPFGDFQRDLKAQIGGHVFCVNAAPVVNRGDALFHIGLEKPVPKDDLAFAKT